MPKYTLNPTKLCNDSWPIDNRDTLKDILIRIIQASKSPFISGGEYHLTYQNKRTIVLLTHNLLIRPRKHHTAQTRVEILNRNAFTQGGFGSIHESFGVLKPEDNYKFKSKPIEKSRICKRIPFTNSAGQTKIMCEALYTSMNPLLHSKPAVFTNHNGYIIMRHAQKEDLFDLVEKLRHGTLTLTIEQRFEITYNIMKAVKEQALNLEILHNDLKPENLIINWEQCTATLIDYYFAQPFIIDTNTITNAEGFFGTPGYIAPEIFSTGQRTIQTELFALGLTIAYFWGDTSSIDTPTQEMLENPPGYYLNRTWTGLYSGLGLPKDIENKITDFLDLMTAINPKHRFAVFDAAMEYWKTIHADYIISQKKYEVPVEESVGALKKALAGFSIFKNKTSSTHNSPTLTHKTHSSDPFRVVDCNARM